MTNSPTTQETERTRFSTLTEEQRDLAKKYINGTAWYFLHPEQNDERAYEVKERIKELHNRLLVEGLKEDDLSLLRKKAKKFINKETKEMTGEQFLLLTKLIFL